MVRSRTDSVLRSVLKNGSWAALGQAVTVGVGLVETFVLARYLSLSDFGIFVTLTAAAELAYGLLDFRNDEAVVRFVPLMNATAGTERTSAFIKLILMLDAGVSILGFIIIAALGKLILAWAALSSVYTTALVIIAFGCGARALVRSVGAYFRICGRFDYATKLGTISQLIRLALMLTVSMVMPTILALSSALATAYVLHMALMGGAFIFVARDNHLKLFSASLRSIRDVRQALISFLLSGNLVGTLRMLSTKVDTLLIVRLTSPAVAAIYKIAGRLAGSLLFFSDPLLVAVYPEISHLHADHRTKQLWKLIRVMTLALAGIASVVIGGFAISGRWILSTLAGHQYDSAYPVVLIMFGGSALAMIFFWARPLLLVWGYAPALLSISAVAFVVQIGALYWLAPTSGALGAAVAFALNYIVHVGLYLFAVVRFRKKDALNQKEEIAAVGT